MPQTRQLDVRTARSVAAPHKRERGFALMVAIILLALLSMIGLASLDTVMRDRQVAGYLSRSRTALYAAEAGVAQATGVVRGGAQALASQGGGGALEDWDPAFPDETSPTLLGTGTQQPSFYADPDATKPIRYIAPSDPCWNGNVAGAMSMNVGGTQWREALWDVRVKGDTPDGSEVTIEAIVTSCHPFTS